MHRVAADYWVAVKNAHYAFLHIMPSRRSLHCSDFQYNLSVPNPRMSSDNLIVNTQTVDYIAQSMNTIA